MQNNSADLFKNLRGVRVLYPVIIGLGVVAFMFWKEFDPNVLSLVHINFRLFFFLLLAIIFMVMRDLGYMIRIRILTGNQLSWKQSFRIIMLWEFSSAVMPSAVGGTTVAMIFLNREGISLGRSTAVVMATSFLDEVYFVLMFPVLLLTIKAHTLFSVGIFASGSQALSFANEFLWFAVIGYLLKLFYTIILTYGLFFNPRGLKWLLLIIFKLPFLRKFRYDAHITGTDIISSSCELKKQSAGFWSKAFAATFFSWSSRYLVVNALLLAFFAVPDHFLLFARQLVMSNMMLVSPTPGGSGFAEFIFTKYLADFIPVATELSKSFGVLLAFLWRLVSYYPYLIIGAIIVPIWIRNRFGKS
jgi:glycosyltransferase 2 family protein